MCVDNTFMYIFISKKINDKFTMNYRRLFTHVPLAYSLPLRAGSSQQNEPPVTLAQDFVRPK